MIEPSEWSPTERMLFVIVLPLAAVLGALLLVNAVRSQPDSAPRATARETPAATAARLQEEARKELVDRYRDCLRAMGAGGEGGFRGRFSQRPDPAKIRKAMSFCRTLMQIEATPRTPTGDPGTPFVA